MLPGYCRLASQRFVFVWLLLATVSGWSAERPLVLDERISQPLDGFVSLLRDPGGQLTFEQVRNGTEPFGSIVPGGLHHGYTADVFWMRIEVESRSSRRLDRMLEFTYAYLDDITLYRVSANGTVEQMRSGRTLAPADRVVAHRKPVFPLSFEPGERATLYLRVATHASMTLNARLAPTFEFYEDSDREYVWLALYFGMLVALGLYNFLLFLGTRQRSFLLYSLFVFSFGIAASSMNGLGPLLLWPGLVGEWGNRILPTGYTLSATLAVMFARRFLNMGRIAPRWDQGLSIMAICWWCATLVTLLVPVQYALKIMSMMGVLTTVSLIATGVAGVRHRIPAARIFLLAWLLLLVGAALLSVRNLGWIPSNFFTVYGLQVGSAVEMILLSFGLAARFNELKRQKEVAQRELVLSLQRQERELEHRVAQRTSELEAAKAELERQVVKDPLTGLDNRYGLMTHLEEVLQRAQRRDELLAVILIDLDGFKPVNDQYGHEAGDELLKAIARLLQQEARETDCVARIGGDEFVVVTENIASEGSVMEVGERLRKAITQPVALPSGKSVSIGASVGITIGRGGEQAGSDLIRRADDAMYRVKRAGKNDVYLLV
ncbi:7TM diverse intracellular signaling domain-containing protein [Marinobacter sp. 1_MG-2023]|uniref:7TM diverse intracellular signaling domain-containing protein n=1 Tax=Marinobacter sp. 1_MG-2023 TaxID=3062627 RepID=UPI0026E19500|nr:7TM diverse intracellular signaling domain-containing protein [Marinobacter sp. 1_MG-2023]MDO6824207.1 diguanylate cyclase [Marinobacter sp. 1_MG-2023]